MTETALQTRATAVEGAPGDPRRPFELLITAEEAYPVLERCFLEAKEEIRAGFRIFDTTTFLRAPECIQIGETWRDLIVHTLNRGVRITFVISDFDCVARPNLHRLTWRSIRHLHEIGARSDRPDLLTATAALHAAQVGLLPRTIFAPKVLSALKEICRELNEMEPEDRERRLTDMPGIRARTTLDKTGNLRPKAWPPSITPATHHQKIAAFDRKVAYIGGLDLNERRYDTLSHNRAAEATWHDVQVRIDGPVAEEVHDHIGRFQAETAGARPKATKHLLRTLSARRRVEWPRLSPRTRCKEIADRHFDEIDASHDLIYLESQFFRDRRLAYALAKAGTDRTDLALVMTLPAAPEDVAFEGANDLDARFGEALQADCVEILQDAFGDRVFFGCPAQLRSDEHGGRDTIFGAPLIYIHAKVSIFDDRTAIVSSANLNGRSMRWDTEAGVALEGNDAANAVKARCMGHWLPPGEDHTPYLSGMDAPKRWRELAEANRAAKPEDRRSFILPYTRTPAREFGRHLPGVPDEMV
ncbi:phospholipase D-like domain-containing protein [Roseicyclus sp. F158]|uniref:Phospholipase D n=1 Tax=Tropicimonas omnivorans TaxID=3075590 RepID=A0ABU3DH78_9RHOB|nr:phospholipase D-like domain-containing protein [Roseicyclus sp. F158]MDT0682527.1 phospholipase D-like domain-containing protein [Roseicyclus sp. F158]